MLSLGHNVKCFAGDNLEYHNFRNAQDHPEKVDPQHEVIGMQ